MGTATCLIPQLQQSSIWLFLKISQGSVFSIYYINQQLAFSCGLANPESTVLYHKLMQKVWEDRVFLLLEKQCTFFYYVFCFSFLNIYHYL